MTNSSKTNHTTERKHVTHLLHFQVDGPYDQVVGSILRDEVHVVHEEPLAVIELLQHAVLLDVLLVLFDEVTHALLSLFLRHVLVLPLGLGVDDGLREAIAGDGVHVPGHQLEVEGQFKMTVAGEKTGSVLLAI